MQDENRKRKFVLLCVQFLSLLFYTYKIKIKEFISLKNIKMSLI